MPEVFVIESNVKKEEHIVLSNISAFSDISNSRVFLKKENEELIFFPELDGSGLTGFRALDLTFIFAWEWEQP